LKSALSDLDPTPTDDVAEWVIWEIWVQGIQIRKQCLPHHSVPSLLYTIYTKSFYLGLVVFTLWNILFSFLCWSLTLFSSTNHIPSISAVLSLCGTLSVIGFHMVVQVPNSSEDKTYWNDLFAREYVNQEKCLSCFWIHTELFLNS
jgi:hypothetical protein